MQCRPHRWNVEDWLPLYRNSRPDDHDSIRCLNCGRELHILDTSPNMRASIAEGIARRLHEGDEYDEVLESVHDWMRSALTRSRP